MMVLTEDQIRALENMRAVSGLSEARMWEVIYDLRDHVREFGIESVNDEVIMRRVRKEIVASWFEDGLRLLDDHLHYQDVGNTADNGESAYDHDMPGKTLDEYIKGWDGLIREVKDAQ